MPHIHEKIDFTADVFIVYQDKVLLRLHDKYKIWLGVGGHIELDEDPIQAALREVKEEVGLDVVLISKEVVPQHEENRIILMSPRYLDRHPISPTHEHISFVYYGKTENDTIVPEKPTDEWLWLNAEELEKMDIQPTIKFYASQALKELGTKN